MSRSFLTIPGFAVFLCTLAAIPLAAQKDAPPPVSPRIPPAAPKVKVFKNDVPTATIEKALAVDPNVNLKLCVAHGELRINGWEKNEVRVFVKDGRNFQIKPLEEDPASKKPVWVWIASSDMHPDQPGASQGCLSGSSIEMDVPAGAALAISGRTTSTMIDTVKKVSIKVVEGKIDLRNISGGVSAEAFQGDVMLGNSSGQISLQTTTGNVVAFDVRPGAIGDLMKVRTNSGSITLQNVEHRQIEANSISGSVNFDGRLLNGGIYTFKTSNGSLRLLLPADSSFKLTASYGFGSFNADLPYKLDWETVQTGGHNIIAVFSKGEASVNLTTTSGNIGIKKQD